MYKFILAIASIIGFLGVGLGAFGAHALKATLEANQRLATYETGIKYLFYHTIALLAVGILDRIFPDKDFKIIALLFIAGIIIFSGSLIILSLTNIKILGAITPIGGVLWLIGWAMLAFKFMT